MKKDSARHGRRQTKRKYLGSRAPGDSRKDGLGGLFNSLMVWHNTARKRVLCETREQYTALALHVARAANRPVCVRIRTGRRLRQTRAGVMWVRTAGGSRAGYRGWRSWRSRSMSSRPNVRSTGSIIPSWLRSSSWKWSWVNSGLFESGTPAPG